MEDPKTCASALLALRTVAEAYGMAKVAEEAGIQRESLYRALSKAVRVFSAASLLAPRWAKIRDCLG